MECRHCIVSADLQFRIKKGNQPRNTYCPEFECACTDISKDFKEYSLKYNTQLCSRCGNILKLYKLPMVLNVLNCFFLFEFSLRNSNGILPSGGDGGEVAKGSTGLDLEAEDHGARPGSVGQDAPQGGAGQEHSFRSDNLERRGERKEKCFCLLYLRCN